MKLQHTIILSLIVHTILLGVAWLSPVETQVVPELDGWEDVQIKPVTLKTITLPVNKPIEPDMPKLDMPEVKAPAKKVEAPKKKKTPKKRKKIIRKLVKKPLKKVVEPPKVEPPKPATKKVASVVTSKDNTEKKTVAVQTKAVVETKSTSGALAVAPARSQATSSAAPPKQPSKHQGSPVVSPSAGVDVNGLIRGYNRSVYRTVNKHKRYPMIARRMRLQGKVYIEIVIDAQGKIKTARIKKSSGHRVLDAEALKTVKRIRQLPSPPSALGWSSRRLTIPMVYRFS